MYITKRYLTKLHLFNSITSTKTHWRMDMKNGNLPASATPYMDLNSGGGELHCDNLGLTKREMIAMHIMASTCWNNTDRNQPQHYKFAAESAVSLADALLKELANV